MEKEQLSKTRRYLYLIKHEPLEWQEECTHISQVEFEDNSEFMKFVKEKMEEYKMKDKFKKWMADLSKKMRSTFIRLSPYSHELTLEIIYFKYAFEKEFESMSKLEREWWIEREVSSIKELIKKEK